MDAEIRVSAECRPWRRKTGVCLIDCSLLCADGGSEAEGG